MKAALARARNVVPDEYPMLKYILVPVIGARTDAPVFATALAVARLFRAHLEFLHVRVDVSRTMLTMMSTDMRGGGGYEQIIESVEQGWPVVRG